MHARVVLGVGIGVLFREVSSVQSTHITTRPSVLYIIYAVKVHKMTVLSRTSQ